MANINQFDRYAANLDALARMAFAEGFDNLGQALCVLPRAGEIAVGSPDGYDILAALMEHRDLIFVLPTTMPRHYRVVDARWPTDEVLHELQVRRLQRNIWFDANWAMLRGSAKLIAQVVDAANYQATA